MGVNSKYWKGTNYFKRNKRMCVPKGKRRTISKTFMSLLHIQSSTQTPLLAGGRMIEVYITYGVVQGYTSRSFLRFSDNISFVFQHPWKMNMSGQAHLRSLRWITEGREERSWDELLSSCSHHTRIEISAFILGLLLMTWVTECLSEGRGWSRGSCCACHLAARCLTSFSGTSAHQTVV